MNSTERGLRAIQFLERAIGADHPFYFSNDLRSATIDAYPEDPMDLNTEEAQRALTSAIMGKIRSLKLRAAEDKAAVCERFAYAFLRTEFGDSILDSSTIRFAVEVALVDLNHGPMCGDVEPGQHVQLTNDELAGVADRVREAQARLIERSSKPELHAEIDDTTAIVLHAIGKSPAAMAAERTEETGEVPMILFACDKGHTFKYPEGQEDARGYFVRYDRTFCPYVVDVTTGGVCSAPATPKADDPHDAPTPTLIEQAREILAALPTDHPNYPVIHALVERLEQRGAIIDPTFAGDQTPLIQAIAKTADLAGTGMRRDLVAEGAGTGNTLIDARERFGAVTTHPEGRIEWVRMDSGDPRLSDVDADSIKVYGDNFAAAPGDYVALMYTAAGRYPTLAAAGGNWAEAVTNLLRAKLEKELDATKTGRASYDAGGSAEPPGMTFRDREAYKARSEGGAAAGELNP